MSANSQPFTAKHTRAKRPRKAPWTPDLFPETLQTRAKARVMMKGVDHSFNDEDPESPYIGHMRCHKCGHDAGWMGFKTLTEARRGAPCPVCNPQKGTDHAKHASNLEAQH